MVLSKIKISFGIQIGLGLILAGAILWFYWPVLTRLVAYLAHSEDYSYGLLLPVVAGYIVYTKLDEIRRRPWQPSWMGLLILAVGLALYFFGELIVDLFLPRVSFVAVLAGLVLLLGGWTQVRQFAFPLLLLLLMLPLPGFLIKQLTIPLQLISSYLAALLLQTVGIPVVRHGNVIDLGVRQLQVVAACSGLRYILSLLALGVIFCYFYQRSLWKAALLIIAVIPAAVLANALRVAGMGVFPALQEGFWHTFSGWLIFVFCFGILGLLNKLLDYLVSQPPASATQEIPPEPELPPAKLHKSYTPYLISALVMVLIAGPLALRSSEVPSVPLLQSLDKFPMQVGAWQGQRLDVDPAIMQELKANDYLSANYVNPEQGSVSIWIASYENQKKSAAIHSPFACMQGSGYKILESGILEVAPGRPVNYMLMDYLGNRSLVYYWFIQQGHWVTSEYLAKFQMVYSRLVSRRADGTLVRLIMPCGDQVQSPQERLTAFTRLLLPILPQFISESRR